MKLNRPQERWIGRTFDRNKRACQDTVNDYYPEVISGISQHKQSDCA